MSHNNLKIGTATPDASSELSPALNDLSDVSGAPSEGELLQYTGGAWAPAALSSSSSMQYLKYGSGESSAYSNSPASSMAAGATLYIYDTSPQNHITGATISQTGDWLNSISLPAGTYRLLANIDISFSATGYMGFALFNSGGTRQTSIGSIGATSTAGAGGPTSSSIITLTGSATLNLEIVNVLNADTVANQGTTISEHGFILIERMVA